MILRSACTAAFALVVWFSACSGAVVSSPEDDGSAGPAGAGAGGGPRCWRCLNGDISQRWFEDRDGPFCPGEQEKYDALRACACKVSECTWCSTDPKFSSYFCDGGPIAGCDPCFYEHCREAREACTDKDAGP